jgi:asparagine synthetase B (glutamine-hydrolysing)
MAATVESASRLRTALNVAIAERPADVLLLSGGVDSSLLAALASQSAEAAPIAITVCLDTPSSVPCPVHGPDLTVPCNSDHDAARDVVSWLGMRWQPIRISRDVAMHALLDLCITLRSFDLGNLNNIPLYVGALRAVRFGAEQIWTGDDADSLFGGYALHKRHADWQSHVAARIPTIRPPFVDIAKHLGVKAAFPYLHPEVLQAASAFTRDQVFARVAASDRSTPASFVDQFNPAVIDAEVREWGKIPLRNIAEDLLPEDIAWRPKIDLEFGSGMCALEPELASTVSGDDRDSLDRTGIRFYNNAHRGLYLRFLDAGGTIPPVGCDEYGCVSCGGGIIVGRTHCPTCGAWPADQR